MKNNSLLLITLITTFFQGHCSHIEVANSHNSEWAFCAFIQNPKNPCYFSTESIKRGYARTLKVNDPNNLLLITVKNTSYSVPLLPEKHGPYHVHVKTNHKGVTISFMEGKKPASFDPNKMILSYTFTVAHDGDLLNIETRLNI